MYSVLEDAELVSLSSGLLTLVVYVHDSPEGIVTFLSLSIDEASAKSHTNAHIVVILNGNAEQFRVFVHNFTDNLELVVTIALDISLESLLGNDFIRQILNLDLDLEGVSLENHQLIFEVVGMIIYGNPNCHRVVLQLTVHLIHI